MILVDATCSQCEGAMRWVPGTPRICGCCTTRLNRLSSPTPSEKIALADVQDDQDKKTSQPTPPRVASTS